MLSCVQGPTGKIIWGHELHTHSHTHRVATVRPGSSECKAYLDVGGVALALLPVDVQAEPAADLADLRSALGKVDPRRLALLPLVHVRRQVIQQLWGGRRCYGHNWGRRPKAMNDGLQWSVWGTQAWWILQCQSLLYSFKSVLKTFFLWCCNFTCLRLVTRFVQKLIAFTE